MTKFTYFVSYSIQTDGPVYEYTANNMVELPYRIANIGDIRNVETMLLEGINAFDTDPKTVCILNFHLLDTNSGSYEEAICPHCGNVAMSHVCPPKE
jgi:hypothetical protein